VEACERNSSAFAHTTPPTQPNANTLSDPPTKSDSNSYSYADTDSYANSEPYPQPDSQRNVRSPLADRNPDHGRRSSFFQ
jgi:hypothetical protein